MKKNGIYSLISVVKQVKDGFSVNGKTLSGIIRIECEDDIATLFASFINFRALSFGEYKLIILNHQKALKSIDLKVRPTSLTKTFEDVFFTEKGYIAGVFVIENEVPLMVACAKTENFSFSATDLKKIVYEKYALLHKSKAKEIAKNFVVKETPNVDINSPTVYNDEVVATENYYAKDYNAQKNGESYEGLPNENDEFATHGKTKEEENETCDTTCRNETNSYKKETFNEQNPYYRKAKRELDDIFLRFPKEENLPKIFPCSKWAKIYYEKDKFYVVGVICEDDKEKYLCYGVQGEYSEHAPKALKGYCCFIPLSIFDLRGKGYWMMFQDAITGDCVKNSIATV